MIAINERDICLDDGFSAVVSQSLLSPKLFLGLFKESALFVQPGLSLLLSSSTQFRVQTTDLGLGVRSAPPSPLLFGKLHLQVGSPTNRDRYQVSHPPTDRLL
jgi:hypothetical protein